MNDSWTFIAILIVIAILPFAVFGAVRLVAWVAPASARRLAAIEQRHHRAYWGVAALMYALIGILHFASANGEPVFGVVFLLVAVAATVKGTRKPRPSVS